MYGHVYLRLCEVSGKGYVGQTTGSPEHRLSEGYNHSPVISAAIRKHGRAAFAVQVLSSTEDQASLDNLERIWIILLNTRVPNRYNLMAGGSGNGKHHPSSRAKISASMRAGGARRPHRGWSPSPETREKIRRTKKGIATVHHTDATKEKCRAAALRWRHSLT